MTQKLLFVFPGINPGGAEKAAIMVANKLLESGDYKISFFIFDDSQYYSSLIYPGINIIQRHIKTENKNKIQRFYISNILFGKLLNSIPGIHSYDCIIAVHEKEPEIAIHQLKIRNLFSGKFSKTKFISIIQASLLGRKMLDKSFTSKVEMIFVNVLRKIFSDHLVAVSSSIKNEFTESMQQKTITINNPVDIKKVSLEAENNFSETDKAVMKKPERYFISVARIDKQKNNLMLVQAFNEIKKETNLNLLLVGKIYDKTLFREIRKFISENNLTNRVFYLESVENPYYYIKNAEAIILASIYEGFPLTILEAMVLKVPVICSRFIGIEETISDKNALILSENNITSLAKAMKKIYMGDYDNKKLDEAFSTASNYDVNNIADKYDKFFKSLSV